MVINWDRLRRVAEFDPSTALAAGALIGSPMREEGNELDCLAGPGPYPVPTAALLAA